MFDVKEFIKNNLIESVEMGMMAGCVANLTAINYMDKGYLTEKEVGDISESINKIEIESENKKSESVPMTEIK